MEFIPNEEELTLIKNVLDFHPKDYAVVRLTETMLKKSIIDASALIRPMLKKGLGVNYDTIPQGTDGKETRQGIIVGHKVHPAQTSYYRPLSKGGDPRLWVYGLKKRVKSGDMIMLTIHNQQLVIIPLLPGIVNKEILKEIFGEPEINVDKADLAELIYELSNRGPIVSVAGHKNYPRAVGDTFEKALGIIPNSSKVADFRSKIELKAKRKGSTTSDTLFSMVPNWDNSQIRSSNEMIRKYGYISSRHPGFMDLFVTVNHKKNNQGLYLEVDEEKGLLYQIHEDSAGKKEITCLWKLEDIEKRLLEKHPETVWVLAEQTLTEAGYHFHYNDAVYTHSPIFSSFLMLISQGIITYDWRGRVRSDGTGYKDKGHCFRIKPKFRNVLFTETDTDFLKNLS
ncbi:MvaI/BcnI family restriction endonuclease [Planococcus salinarum]|uniref:MvaI/BcnI family restriction endonuclease n=1 Tax=Planococcus salinarum TaxID=622695 RepID=UPI000E3D380F|nr:MvaI/BcnI family restriction endonuclease [Planococcus salinarum]TAA73139.1 hypothetical protein D2909_02155 [Planococcus salinarum]